MVFGLFRSLSDSKKRPAQRQTRAPRPRSTHVRASNANEAIQAYNKATAIYEAECDQLQRDDMIKRGKNDRECKRQMESIERRLQDERRRLDMQNNHQGQQDVANYRAGKISGRELEKRQNKMKRQVDDRMNELGKWRREEQAKAQRIFYARNEEIGASTGAALRRAKVKMERNKNLASY